MRSSHAAGAALELASQPEKIRAAGRSLRILLEGDKREQRETFASLKQALDEDRPSNRKLFRRV